MTNFYTVERAHWSANQKVAFRFFFVFFILFIIVDPNNCVPFYEGLSEQLLSVFYIFIPWAAKHTLHLNVPIYFDNNGDGDTLFEYLLVLLTAIISVITTAIWTYTGRKTHNYNTLLYWLLVALRFYVASSMINYGSAKVIKVQFPAPSITTLSKPLGDLYPSELVWAYIGYSPWFNYVTGVAELLCAALLLFRRTTTLGAIIGIVLVSNIVLINYCYGVSVKITSTGLLFMCIFLTVPDFRSLFNFFFRKQEALPANLTPHRFKTNWKNNILLGLKYFLVIYIIYVDFGICLKSDKRRGDHIKKPPLYGLYEVNTFVKNQDTLKPLITDTTRWRKFWITSAKSGAVKLMNDSILTIRVKTDTVKHLIVASTYADTVHKFHLHYIQEKPGTLVLRGKWKQDSVYIKMNKMDLGRIRLTGTGFHMIDDSSY